MAEKAKLTREEVLSFDGSYICIFCKNLIDVGTPGGPDLSRDFNGWKCKAFPNGIPPVICAHQERHDVVYVGQEGQFVFDSIELDMKCGRVKLTWDYDFVMAES